MKAFFALLISVVSTVTFAGQPTMQLKCGKANGYNFKAERKYDGHLYNVMVTFITKRPDDKTTDKVLRECIDASLKLDDQKNLLATAWFRPIAGMKDSDDEQLHPYGDLKYISYSAKTKKVEVKGLLDK